MNALQNSSGLQNSAEGQSNQQAYTNMTTEDEQSNLQKLRKLLLLEIVNFLTQD